MTLPSILVALVTARLWIQIFDVSLFDLAAWRVPLLEGFVTSFCKHPIEILSDGILSAVVVYPLLGCSLMGAFWYNFFAATGEYFYHANVRTPTWLRYWIQTPELHSIHHQYGVHAFDYSDIPIWDRLFGTYRDAVGFADRCGFEQGAESRLGEMLAFKDASTSQTTA